MHYAPQSGGVLASLDGGVTDINTIGDMQSVQSGQHLFSLNTNPLLDNPEGNSNTMDIGPTGGSPAIGAGLFLNDVQDDFYHFNRNVFPTIGAIEYDITVGLGQESNESELSVYPNPANDYLNIESLNGSVNRIEIFNGNGALVYSKKTNGVSKQQIDISRFSSGIYLLLVETQKGISQQKIVVE